MASFLGCKNSVFIYADLEWDYQPSKEWIEGWWSRMKSWMGVGCGGFYCTPVANNFNFPIPYCKAVTDSSDPLTFRRLWAESPDTKDMWYVPKGPLNLSTIDFKPDQPPCENVSALWQYFKNHGDKFPTDELPDLDLAIDQAWDVMWKSPERFDPTSRHRVQISGGDPASASGSGGSFGGAYADGGESNVGADDGDPAA
jgi:hypothetical protein